MAAATSSAVAQLSSGMLPPDVSVPVRPCSRKLCRNGPPAISVARPRTAKAPNAEPLERVERLLLRQSLPRRVAGGQEHEQDRARDDDAALEAAAGREVAEGDHPYADQERDPDHQRPDQANLLAAHARCRRLTLVALSEQQHDADDGPEEDELLAERVEAAVVEDDGGDRVRRVPLGRRAVVDDRPVAAVEGASRAVPRGPRRGRRRARRAPAARGTCGCARASFLLLLVGRLPRRVRAIAARTMSG